MHILHVIGARPNFMKAAPVIRALADAGRRQTLVHTGQHYDFNMSDVFFQQLGMPEPDVNLQVGSGSHAKQSAEIMIGLEPVLLERKPDVVVVYGDVNSTVAAALVCSKLLIPVAHVEAGLRSFDRTMPEEINRLLTDQVSDLLFTHSAEAGENLLREGIPAKSIRMVGNVMIDTLVHLLPEAGKHMPAGIPEKYVLVTMHRPSNVDAPEFLEQLLQAFVKLSQTACVLFPVHPRTRERIRGLNSSFVSNGKVRLLEALPYLAFLALEQRAAVVITDSGGVQEETTFLQVPCITVRENTERPVTVSSGSNILVGRDLALLEKEAGNALAGRSKQGQIPPLWDGCAAQRIAKDLA
jgi:UDP-N-acetylglucosamine 2-epimerase (non-hydrolysing)